MLGEMWGGQVDNGGRGVRFTVEEWRRIRVAELVFLLDSRIEAA